MIARSGFQSWFARASLAYRLCSSPVIHGLTVWNPGLVRSNPSRTPGIKMSRELSLGGPIILDPPPRRRSLARYAIILAAMLCVGGGVWGWSTGFRPAFLESKPLFDLQLVEVDEGDVVEYVIENGTLESGSNTIVRCEVEALTGTVGGSSATGATGQSGSSGSGSGQGTSGSGSSSSGQGGSGGAGGSGSNSARRPPHRKARAAASRRAAARSPDRPPRALRADHRGEAGRPRQAAA